MAFPGVGLENPGTIHYFFSIFWCGTSVLLQRPLPAVFRLSPLEFYSKCTSVMLSYCPSYRLFNLWPTHSHVPYYLFHPLLGMCRRLNFIFLLLSRRKYILYTTQYSNLTK